jgi:hypothetical protein
MIISVEQLRQIYTMLQEYPQTTMLDVDSKILYEGEYAVAASYYAKGVLLDTIDIEEKNNENLV